ncbi:hypothetical protein C0995_013769 [Termitomyces sp. Mi166|nr:hypothetical protein C0995_013769 [Termitomyces sp. Mi166\
MSTKPGSYIIDDTAFTYLGQWHTGGTRPEYRSTTHGTNAAGASASLSFFGTSISVYGTIAVNAKPAVSIYTVDGSYSNTFIANPVKTVQYNQLFYQISGLAYKQHILFITCTNDKAQFWLDYVKVGIEGPTTTSSILAPKPQPVTSSKAPTILSTTISTLPSSSSSPSSSPSKSILILPSSTVTSFADVAIDTSSTTSSLTSVRTSSNSAPSAAIGTADTNNSTSSGPSASTSSGEYAPPGSSSQMNSPSSGNHAGAIAGGVIATLVCIALAVVALLWLRRRRAMRAPSRRAPKTPDPRWFTRHSFQWPTNEKIQADRHPPAA